MPRAASMPPRSTIDSAGPADRLEQGADLGLGGAVVAADEDRVVAADPARIDHHGAVDGVQRLHHAGLGEGRLDPLAEALVVAEGQPRRHPPREVERDGDVDQGLAGEVVGAGARESVQRGDPRRAVEEQLAARQRRRRRCRPWRPLPPRRSRRPAPRSRPSASPSSPRAPAAASSSLSRIRPRRCPARRSSSKPPRLNPGHASGGPGTRDQASDTRSDQRTSRRAQLSSSGGSAFGPSG